MERSKALFGGIALACSLWLGALANSSAAFADTFNDYVQVTCAPEIGYFAIRRFGVMNLPHDVARRIGKSPGTTITEHGIYDVFQLKAAPVECNLRVGLGSEEPEWKTGEPKLIRLRVTGFYDDNNGATTSYHLIVEYVEVSLEGKKVGELSLNPYGLR
jgi:hypothetical protein